MMALRKVFYLTAFIFGVILTWLQESTASCSLAALERETQNGTQSDTVQLCDFCSRSCVDVDKSSECHRNGGFFCEQTGICYSRVLEITVELLISSKDLCEAHFGNGKAKMLEDVNSVTLRQCFLGMHSSDVKLLFFGPYNPPTCIFKKISSCNVNSTSINVETTGTCYIPGNHFICEMILN